MIPRQRDQRSVGRHGGAGETRASVEGLFSHRGPYSKLEYDYDSTIHIALLLLFAQGHCRVADSQGRIRPHGVDDRVILLISQKGSP